jgi:heat shock protein 1/8
MLMIGGSSRIPKLQERIKAFFKGKELCVSFGSGEEVAHGAAVQAAILSGNGDASNRNIVLLDATTHSLGIETEGAMTNIIHRNTSVPCKKTRAFETHIDNQPAFSVKVWHCADLSTDA